ncbi:transglycosylase SLT domain-containing protein [Patescibacteria group bacterium]
MKKYALVTLLLLLTVPFSASSAISEKWGGYAITAAKKVPQEYRDFINIAADEYQIAPSAIAMVIVVESLGDPNAVSESNAKCLMQTKDYIGAEVGRPGNSCDPYEAIMRGTAYLAKMRDDYGYDWIEKMLVAYKDGPNAVKRMSDEEILDHSYVEKAWFVLKHIPANSEW